MRWQQLSVGKSYVLFPSVQVRDIKYYSVHYSRNFGKMAIYKIYLTGKASDLH